MQRPRRPDEGNDSGGGGEDEAFDEELPQQSCAARADRRTHRHLAVTRRSACEQQRAEIRAHDQQ
jgi:hypothetical protein